MAWLAASFELDGTDPCDCKQKARLRRVADRPNAGSEAHRWEEGRGGIRSSASSSTAEASRQSPLDKGGRGGSEGKAKDIISVLIDCRSESSESTGTEGGKKKAIRC